MVEFLLLEQNFPFAIALGLLIVVAFMEGIGSLIGGSLSSLFDGLVPDVDFDLPGLDSPSLFTKLFAWLRVGKVPVIMLLLAFLCAFTIAGLVIQKSALAANDVLLANWVAALIAFLVSLPIVGRLPLFLKQLCRAMKPVQCRGRRLWACKLLLPRVWRRWAILRRRA